MMTIYSRENEVVGTLHGGSLHVVWHEGAERTRCGKLATGVSADHLWMMSRDPPNYRPHFCGNCRRAIEALR